MNNWNLKKDHGIKLLQLSLMMTNFTYDMMTSSNGNIFRITGHLCGEITGHQWIPHTKASDVKLWYFLCLSLNKHNREAGELRCHHAHYDVTVMKTAMTKNRHSFDFEITKDTPHMTPSQCGMGGLYCEYYWGKTLNMALLFVFLSIFISIDYRSL